MLPTGSPVGCRLLILMANSCDVHAHHSAALLLLFFVFCFSFSQFHNLVIHQTTQPSTRSVSSIQHTAGWFWQPSDVRPSDANPFIHQLFTDFAPLRIQTYTHMHIYLIYYIYVCVCLSASLSGISPQSKWYENCPPAKLWISLQQFVCVSSIICLVLIVVVLCYFLPKQRLNARITALVAALSGICPHWYVQHGAMPLSARPSVRFAAKSVVPNKAFNSIYPLFFGFSLLLLLRLFCSCYCYCCCYCSVPCIVVGYTSVYVCDLALILT